MTQKSAVEILYTNLNLYQNSKMEVVISSMTLYTHSFTYQYPLSVF